jgi:hypothetical protein
MEFVFGVPLFLHFVLWRTVFWVDFIPILFGMSILDICHYISCLLFGIVRLSLAFLEITVFLFLAFWLGRVSRFGF